MDLQSDDTSVYRDSDWSDVKSVHYHESSESGPEPDQLVGPLTAFISLQQSQTTGLVKILGSSGMSKADQALTLVRFIRYASVLLDIDQELDKELFKSIPRPTLSLLSHKEREENLVKRRPSPSPLGSLKEHQERVKAYDEISSQVGIRRTPPPPHALVGRPRKRVSDYRSTDPDYIRSHGVKPVRIYRSSESPEPAVLREFRNEREPLKRPMIKPSPSLTAKSVRMFINAKAQAFRKSISDVRLGLGEKDLVLDFLWTARKDNPSPTPVPDWELFKALCSSHFTHEGLKERAASFSTCQDDEKYSSSPPPVGRAPYGSYDSSKRKSIISSVGVRSLGIPLRENTVLVYFPTSDDELTITEKIWEYTPPPRTVVPSGEQAKGFNSFKTRFRSNCSVHLSILDTVLKTVQGGRRFPDGSFEGPPLVQIADLVNSIGRMIHSINDPRAQFFCPINFRRCALNVPLSIFRCWLDEDLNIHDHSGNYPSDTKKSFLPFLKKAEDDGTSISSEDPRILPFYSFKEYLEMNSDSAVVSHFLRDQNNPCVFD